MSRPTTKELYDIDPKTFIGMPYEKVTEILLDSMHKQERELYMLLTEVTDSDDFAIVNEEFKYIRGAISDLLSLYSEMGLKYRRKND